MGASLDSKKVTSALGYLDLKQICYCLAQALMKHIEFSQGFFFLGDLQEHIKKGKGGNGGGTVADDAAAEAEGDGNRNAKLEFTYNLGDKFRIDIEAAKKRKEAREEESKQNFLELKK